METLGGLFVLALALLPTGSRNVSPDQTTTCRLTASDGNGDTDSATVTIIVAP